MDFSENIINDYILAIMSMFGKIGVSIFVLISGYFNTDESINKRKILEISRETRFYSLVLLAVSYCFGESVGIKDIVMSIFPVIFGNYWYVTAFIILLFVAPYINEGLFVLGRERHGKLIVILLFIYSVCPTLIGQIDKAYGINNYMLFPVFYIIGAYFRLYSNTLQFKKYYVVLIGSAIVIQCASPILFHQYFPNADGAFIYL